MLLFLTGCFAGFITDYFSYQATEYVVDEPRIVAIRMEPLQPVAGQPLLIDALTLAPPDWEKPEVELTVCGLGKDTMTFIWGLDCFELEEEITFLGSGQLPLNITVPDFPKIENCFNDEAGEPQEDSGENESENIQALSIVNEPELNTELPDLSDGEVSILELDTGWEEPCFHGLPTLLKATWSERDFTARAVDFGPWYDEQPDAPLQPLHSKPLDLQVPETAKPGERVELRFTALEDLRGTTVHWYIDQGVLLGTGLSGVSEFEPPTSLNPFGKSTSSNVWEIPEDASGVLRVWVVVHYGEDFFPWKDPDMAWRMGQLEVIP